MENLKTTPEFQYLKGVYDQKQQAAPRDVSIPMIQVNEVIGYLAFIYEKTRNVVEFAESHVLRKNTIKRILKRKLLETRDPYEIAGGLLRELVRYRHLPNNEIPESKIGEVARVVIRYQMAKKQISGQLPLEQGREIRRFLLDVSITEIDDMVVPKEVDYAFVNYGYTILNPIVALEDQVGEDFKNVQVFIACLKTFMKLDDEMLKYHLMGVIYPQWFMYQEDLPDTFIPEILQAHASLDAHLNYNLRKKIANFVHRNAAYFTVLRDAFEHDQAKFLELLSSPAATQIDPFHAAPETLEGYLEKLIDKRNAEIRSQLVRRSIRAFIYILITKALISVFVEIPYDLLTESAINYMTLGINIAFPLVLILVMAVTIRIPGKDNTRKLIQGVYDLIYANMDSEAFAAEKIVEMKKGTVTNTISAVMYGLLFVLIYGGIIWGLLQLDFNIVSGAIFVLLVSVISYFAVLLRQPARSMRVLKDRENIFGVLLNVLSLPILKLGRILSENFSKINIFVYILDVLIEAPFQVLMEVFDNWFDYLRGKREEIV